MSLNYVTLTGNLGSGAAGAWATFTPTNWEFDATDHLVLPPEPIPVQLSGTGAFSTLLLATDNAPLTPSGWQWQVTFSGIRGVNSFSYNFLLPFANGATQDLSAIPAAQAVTAMAAYLPLPTGSPQAGQIPVVQANGSPVTAWTNPSGGVSSVTAADASIAVAGTLANPTVAAGTLDQIAALHAPAANWSNNSKKITSLANGAAASDAAAFGQIPTSASAIGGLVQVATTGAAGFALQNATPNIISWTAPNDGNMHRVLAFGQLRVITAETGGIVSATFTYPDGSASPVSTFAGGTLGAGYHALTNNVFLIQANTTIQIAQTSALTAGSAVIWAELWAL